MGLGFELGSVDRVRVRARVRVARGDQVGGAPHLGLVVRVRVRVSSQGQGRER